MRQLYRWVGPGLFGCVSYLLILMAVESVARHLTKHLWIFTAKQHCGILPNHLSGWELKT